MMQSFSLFSINAHRIVIPNWSEEHRDRILELVPKNYEELNQSVDDKRTDDKLEYTDYFRYSEEDPPYAEALFEVLRPLLDDFFKENEISRITALWCQRYKSGDYHAPHDHGSLGYSAVLYAKMNSEVHPGTQFFSPFPSEKGCKENIYTKAEEGDLLIFPAHITHMAPPHYDNDELRVIFSFNFI
tara:strand:+ start:78 stop:635 length:558 start_codon:yes stop_codon:yes gene_type:complete